MKKRSEQLLFFRRKMTNMPYYRFMTVQLLLLFIIDLSFVYIMSAFIMLLNLESDIPINPHKFNFPRALLYLIMGTVFETYVFQTIPYYAFRNSKRGFSPTKYVFWSSSIFGMAHIMRIDPHGVLFINITQIFLHFLAGVVFAYTYYIAIRKNKNAFISVATIHLTSNIIVVGIMWFATP